MLVFEAFFFATYTRIVTLQFYLSFGSFEEQSIQKELMSKSRYSFKLLVNYVWLKSKETENLS